MVNLDADIVNFIEQQYTIITPNNRLSQQIISTYGQQKLLENNGNSISKPRCCPYKVFLEQIFAEIKSLFPQQSHPLLLTPLQEKYLLQQTLNCNINGNFLSEIHEALSRCYNWNIDIESSEFDYNQQTKYLKNIHKLFTQKLKELNAITYDLLPAYIKLYIHQKNNQISQFKSICKTLWLSFDDYTPAQISLQQNLQSAGFTVQHQDVKTNPANNSKMYVAKDNIDELDQVIAWVKASLADSKKLGIIIPNLNMEANLVQRRLQLEFDNSQFNISLGKKLIEYPLIAHALQFLKLENEYLAYEDVRIILNSPYLGYAEEEFWQRSRLIEQHEILQENYIPFENLLKIAEENTPKFYQLLSHLNTYPESADLYTWTQIFKKRLKCLSFPGQLPLDSHNYQCLQRLMALFDEFISLGLIFSAVNKTDAITILIELAQLNIFQPKSGTTQIEVMGLLEASGLYFDKIWITGLTNMCLPQKTKLSPFIPNVIQKQYQMPHALDERELKYAQQILTRLRNASYETILSYPALTGDLPNMPSPLISEFASFEAMDSLLHTDQYVEEYSDQYQIELTEEPKGGSQILTNQSQCPFKAFAIHRLKAKQPYYIKDSLSMKEKGIIIHKILELLWQDLKTQQALINLDESTLEEKINTAIHLALKPFVTHERFIFPEFIQQIEIERLRELTKELLNWEKQRPQFEILNLEEKFKLNIGELKLDIRVDRIDKITPHATEPEINVFAVIDYKTSKVTFSIKSLTDERPENPQLLIYAMLNPNIAALLFLELHKGQVKQHGLAATKDLINDLTTPKKEETWDDYYAKWDDILQKLSKEFTDGIALPQPTKASYCDNCWVKGICRKVYN